MAELAVVRELFFAQPGRSLGQQVLEVTSQGIVGNGTDKQFVENVLWSNQGIVFATFNFPGGSNDDDPVTAGWTGIFANTTLQEQERSERGLANARWLNATFDLATANNAPSVILMTQADMWDTRQIPSPGLNGYTPFVTQMASRILAFNKPVLLICGDSHVKKFDSPLLSNNATAPFTPSCDTSTNSSVLCDLSKIHNTPQVPNFRRLIVKGSGEAGATLWHKIIIDPTATTPSNAFTITDICYDNCP